MENNIQLQYKGKVFKGCFLRLKSRFKQVFKCLNGVKGYLTFN